MKIIDAHLHLFDLQAGEYRWLSPDNPPFWPDKPVIAKNFSESDLVVSAPSQLTGFVHIEAGFDNAKPWREADYLAQHCHMPFRAVAGFDLLAGNNQHVISELLKRPCITGVRHILDDEAASVLNDAEAKASLALLAEAGLSFDAQLSLYDTAGVQALSAVAADFPAMSFILNHAGFPLADKNIKVWQDNLKALSRADNIAVKLSGWEMHNRQWRADDIVPVVNTVHQYFGESRVMTGSNFPLCTWHSDYGAFWHTITQAVPALCADKWLSENSLYWYFG